MLKIVRWWAEIFFDFFLKAVLHAQSFSSMHYRQLFSLVCLTEAEISKKFVDQSFELRPRLGDMPSKVDQFYCQILAKNYGSLV